MALTKLNNNSSADGILTDVEINTGTLSGTHILGYSSVTGAWVNADPGVWFISKQSETISNITWSSASKALNITRANATFGPLTLTDVAIENSNATFADLTVDDIIVDNGTNSIMRADASLNKVQILTDLFVTGSVYAQDFVRGEGNTTAFSLAANGRITTGENLVVTGSLTFNGGTSNNHLVFPDNKEIRFGSNDLRIYHDGTYNRILSTAAQPLLIAGQGIWLSDHVTGENYLRTTPNGTVQLYYDSAERIKTTSAGVEVTGTITSTGGSSTNWNTAYADTSTATSAFTGNKIAKRDSNGSCKFRDLWVDRNDNTGALYFSNSGSRYLYYNGSTYQFANAPILASTGTSTFGGISSTGAIVSTKGADAIQLFNGSTQVGQIEAADTTWLRINQDIAKNIYTPRYIRADGGFFVDSTAKGINGLGNYIGGTVSCTGLTNSGGFTGRVNTSTVFNSSNDTGSMSVRGDSTHPAVISFHRAGAYAVNFGLDGTNMKLGGWSASTTKFQWNMSNGDFHADGNVTAYSTTVSDERLKDDVQLITSALDTVDSLRGVTYTWNAGSRKGKRDYGVIAQEVEQVIPEIVHETTMPLINGDEETIYKTVDYEKLCAVLINAVSELRAEVEALKNGSSD